MNKWLNFGGGGDPDHGSGSASGSGSPPILTRALAEVCTVPVLLVYMLCSKRTRFALTHVVARRCQWSIATSITSYSRSFKTVIRRFRIHQCSEYASDSLYTAMMSLNHHASRVFIPVFAGTVHKCKTATRHETLDIQCNIKRHVFQAHSV